MLEDYYLLGRIQVDSSSRRRPAVFISLSEIQERKRLDCLIHVLYCLFGYNPKEFLVGENGVVIRWIFISYQYLTLTDILFEL